MLVFALTAAAVGLAVGVLGFALAVAGDPLVSSMLFLGPLFMVAIVSFALAVFGHPAVRRTGTEWSVRAKDVLRSAPHWSVALVVSSMIWVLFERFRVPGMPDEISLLEIPSHPEWTRSSISVAVVFLSYAVMLSLSGLRWGRVGSKAWTG
jgi:hypothetical protein